MAIIVLGIAAFVATIERAPEAVASSQAGVSLAVQQTLDQDLRIRLTEQFGEAILRTAAWTLLGWVKADEYPQAATRTPKAFLSNYLNDFKAGEQNSTGNKGNRCLWLMNTNDDNGDGQSCRCSPDPYVEFPQNSLANNPRNFAWENVKGGIDCDVCDVGASGNPTPVSGSISGAPTQTWDQGVYRRAYMRDPGDPTDTETHNWFMGDFHDLTLTYDSWKADPDCFAVDNICPEIAVPTVQWTNGIPQIVPRNLPCDGTCDLSDPALNDIPISYEHTDHGIELEITLRDIKLDGWNFQYIGVAHCCHRAQSGSLLHSNDLTVTTRFNFIDGYWSMAEAVGADWGQQVGYQESIPRSCAYQRPSSGWGNSPYENLLIDFRRGAVTDLSVLWLEDDSIVGLEGYLVDSTMATTPGLAQTANTRCMTSSVSALCSATWTGWPYFEFIGWILDGVIDNVLDTYLARNFQEIIGIPIDLVMALSGQPALAEDICHMQDSYTTGLRPCDDVNNYCPCDDHDGDGVLNYADPYNASLYMPGCPDHVWCGNWMDEDTQTYVTGDRWQSNWYGIVDGGPSTGVDDLPLQFEIGAHASHYAGGDGSFHLGLSYTKVPLMARNSANPLQGTYVDRSGEGWLWDDGEFWEDAVLDRTCLDPSEIYLDPISASHSLGASRGGAPNPPTTITNQFGPFTITGQVDVVDWVLTEYDRIGGNGMNDATIMISQQMMQEWLYSHYIGGAFCLDVTEDNYPQLASNQTLHVSNMVDFLPFLANEDTFGNAIWDQNGTVRIATIPKEVPQARILGLRRGCWPWRGDHIGEGVFFTNDANTPHPHDNAILHTTEDCGAVTNTTNLNVYDLSVFIPEFQLEFYAPAADGTEQHLFSLLTTLYGAVAIQKSFASHRTRWGGTQGFLELVGDILTGCTVQDLILDNNMAPIPVSGPNGEKLDCQVIAGDVDLSELQSGFSQWMSLLISSLASFTLQTQYELSLFDVDIAHVGVAKSPHHHLNLMLDADPVNDAGRGNPDYLAVSLQFGTFSMQNLMGVMSGASTISTSPLATLDTLVSIESDALDAVYTSNPHLALDTIDSGIWQQSSDPVVQFSVNQAESDVTYSYRINGGLWSPYRARSFLPMAALPTGKHQLEVRSRIDSIVDDTPAVVEFVVDRVAPSVRFRAGAIVGQGSDAYLSKSDHVELVLNDNMTEPSNLTVEVWDGSWLGHEGSLIDASLVEDVASGTSALRVRVTDAAGNQTVASLPISSEAAFGCTTTNTNTSAWVLVFLITYFRFRRRRVR